MKFSSTMHLGATFHPVKYVMLEQEAIRRFQLENKVLRSRKARKVKLRGKVISSLKKLQHHAKSVVMTMLSYTKTDERRSKGHKKKSDVENLQRYIAPAPRVRTMTMEEFMHLVPSVENERSVETEPQITEDIYCFGGYDDNPRRAKSRLPEQKPKIEKGHVTKVANHLGPHFCKPQSNPENKAKEFVTERETNIVERILADKLEDPVAEPSSITILNSIEKRLESPRSEENKRNTDPNLVGPFLTEQASNVTTGSEEDTLVTSTISVTTDLQNAADSAYSGPCPDAASENSPDLGTEAIQSRSVENGNLSSQNATLDGSAVVLRIQPSDEPPHSSHAEVAETRETSAFKESVKCPDAVRFTMPEEYVKDPAIMAAMTQVADANRKVVSLHSYPTLLDESRQDLGLKLKPLALTVKDSVDLCFACNATSGTSAQDAQPKANESPRRRQSTVSSLNETSDRTAAVLQTAKGDEVPHSLLSVTEKTETSDEGALFLRNEIGDELPHSSLREFVEADEALVVKTVFKSPETTEIATKEELINTSKTVAALPDINANRSLSSCAADSGVESSCSGKGMAQSGENISSSGNRAENGGSKGSSHTHTSLSESLDNSGDMTGSGYGMGPISVEPNSGVEGDEASGCWHRLLVARFKGLVKLCMAFLCFILRRLCAKKKG